MPIQPQLTYATDYANVVGTTGGADTAVDIPSDAPVITSSTTYTTSGIILPTTSTDAMGEDTTYTYGNSGWRDQLTNPYQWI